MKLFEMEGFLRGKCVPGDMKVNESNAEYLVRKFSELTAERDASQAAMNTITALMEILGPSDSLSISGQVAEMKARCEALAAENACLKQSIEEVAEAFETGTDGVLATAVDESLNLLTPETDAVLKRIQAQGVEMFAYRLKQFIDDGDFVGSEIPLIVGCIDCATDMAAQIRKGVQS